MSRIPVLGVIGPNGSICSNEVYEFGFELGKKLCDRGYMVASGVASGFMEAVFKGYHHSDTYRPGYTIGIIPSSDFAKANPYCDVVIPTGVGLARNAILVNCADIIIAVAGGAGTLSELCYAWQTGKRVLCLKDYNGWAKKLAGENLDERNKNLFTPVHGLQDCLANLSEHFASI